MIVVEETVGDDVVVGVADSVVVAATVVSSVKKLIEQFNFCKITKSIGNSCNA